ncbi:MAG TPA: hypothetical protein VMT64_14115 [Candidatus Binataceae bacterium]|nr:hypothetical protein [Candidatus Binataceae bacterium]
MSLRAPKNGVHPPSIVASKPSSVIAPATEAFPNPPVAVPESVMHEHAPLDPGHLAAYGAMVVHASDTGPVTLALIDAVTRFGRAGLDAAPAVVPAVITITSTNGATHFEISLLHSIEGAYKKGRADV